MANRQVLVGDHRPGWVSVKMHADAPGELTDASSESLTYPSFDVLVVGPIASSDFEVLPEDIDFGKATLNIVPVPKLDGGKNFLPSLLVIDDAGVPRAFP